MISIEKSKKVYELVELFDLDMVCDTQGLKLETVKNYVNIHKRFLDKSDASKKNLDKIVKTLEII